MIDAIRDRLQAQVAAFRSVRTTADLGSLVDGGQRHQLPAAFVHPVADRARPNTLTSGAVMQRLVREAGVLVVVATTGPERSAEPIEPLLEAERAALLGWAPPGMEPLHLAGGEVVRIAGGTAMWLERWTTAAHLRST
jgi:hypothetical protein